MGFLFNELLIRPIINILLVLYQILSSIGIPYPLGFSIIGLTIIIRLVMYPLTASQLKASKKMQDLAPHLSRVKDRHKHDKTRLHQETMKLYKEHGVNPAAGCLPLLIQFPVIWALYTVSQKIIALNGGTIVSEVNKLAYDIPFLRLTRPWELDFFGIPLGQNPSQLISIMPLIVLVPLLTALLTFIQSKMMIAKSPIIKRDNNQPDFSSAFQTQSLYFLPAMIGFFSYTFPIGLSLYWNTFTVFGILQQYKISGLGSLETWIKKLKGA